MPLEVLIAEDNTAKSSEGFEFKCIAFSIITAQSLAAVLEKGATPQCH